ncbi:TlpA family protein disulfide reductase [Candidatus Poribacteria bacterium]|nr:TlpA family protein disulfide reductase [Candidatus Poribacteria bacterium]MBT5712618.1 TlpA family protein disulfide reductase [Candidatus Poribacteria bacterium]MBT7096826.1 TlpA family protein disulfide reductase [Candidatus Poribacteria bacterium]MBT7804427.1 TlpA family protein disulfide reductase [Candidatus Poribacteria bacterium]
MSSKMDRWRARGPVVASLLAVVIAAPSWAGLKLDFETPEGKVEVPNIEGADVLTGEAVSLAELKGHVVVIDIWATWCLPCVKELPGLTKFQEEHKEEQFTYVGLSVDAIETADDVKEFVEKRELNYPVFMGNREMMQVLGRAIGRGIQGIPTKIVVDRTGHIAFFVEGSPAVSKADHEEYISRLEKLLEAPIPEDTETALAD